MKKIFYSLLVLTLIVFPMNVFAAVDGFSFSQENITVEVGDTEKIVITAYNVIGDLTFASDNTAIATVDKDAWGTGQVADHVTVNSEITVTGVAVGTTTLTIGIDGALYDADATDVSGTRKINVTVVEAGSDPVVEYTVKYNANGGKDAPESQGKKAGEKVTISSVVPKRDGYEFTGWNTLVDGKGNAYSPNDQYADDANLELFAQWKQTSNVTKNPQTGDTLIYVVLLLTLGALIYSYWYMKKAQEN